ncbi:hypothetical protein GBA52_004487 [Prunus armeniaca]|nr:hypothetical protein GBA52_004487 [Prunus armeniaca]
MASGLEKPRVTEIHVRMDCNGCVQKIKKALHGINGIYDLYIDFPQQKLTIIGWADPEKIVKAIKKTRKIATICSHTEQQTEPAPPPTEQEAPEEPPKESPPPELPTPEAAPVAAEANPGHQMHHPPRDVGEVHTIYHHPPDYGYRYGHSQGYTGYWNRYHNSQGHPQEPTPIPMGPTPTPTPPVYVTHSYNTYRPSPYVTEYEYIQPPPQPAHLSRMNYYNEEHHINVSNSNGNITSIFSDENPNACAVM